MIAFLKRLFDRQTNNGQSIDVESSVTCAELEGVPTEATVSDAVDEASVSSLRNQKLIVQSLGADELKAWACTQCGAALPREVDDCNTVTCVACGSVFRLPQASMRSLGVTIDADMITIGGDVVGGSKIVFMKSEPEPKNISS